MCKECNLAWQMWAKKSTNHSGLFTDALCMVTCWNDLPVAGVHDDYTRLAAALLCKLKVLL